MDVALTLMGGEERNRRMRWGKEQKELDRRPGTRHAARKVGGEAKGVDGDVVEGFN